MKTPDGKSSSNRSEHPVAGADEINPQTTKLTELAWLSEVAESRQPLSEICPIWVRHGTVKNGPPVPHPERHPFCEFGTTLSGVVDSFVERERATRMPGDLFLAGPGVPHWATVVEYPFEFITVYFLPSVLIEIGPESDGAKLIARFTSSQSLSERLVRPPPQLRTRITRLLKEMIAEFNGSGFGREIRLRVLLMSALVELLRWEEANGRDLREAEEFDWGPVNKALHYLREHFSEPIYARNLAKAAGISESRMKALFHHSLGMSWVKYLQGYRIHRAAALLCLAGSSITEAALNCGFDSISHFNSTFRSFMGVCPTEYQKSSRERLAEPAPAPAKKARH
jgi:AraC-like DNA-binding protein